jgi:hypothetical protein
MWQRQSGGRILSHTLEIQVHHYKQLATLVDDRKTMLARNVHCDAGQFTPGPESCSLPSMAQTSNVNPISEHTLYLTLYVSCAGGV